MQNRKEMLIKQIVAELTVCFIHMGRKVDDTVHVLAASLENALEFNSVDEVIESFKKAKMVVDIPNQKSLYEALKNYREEVVKYRKPIEPANTLEYKDPRSAWMPKTEVEMRVNYFEAIKNYCIAMGNEWYDRYVQLHVRKVDLERRGDKNVKVMRWEKPAERYAFDKPIEDQLKVLYKAYLRNLPRYSHFPEGARMNLGMKPPTVQEMKLMIDQFNKEHYHEHE